MTTRRWALVLGVLGACATGCGRTEWVELQAGGTRTCARSEDGAVQCWGGRLESGGSVPTLIGSNVPVATPKQEGVTSLCAGASFVCARVVGGRVMCLAPGEEASWTELTGLNGIALLSCSDGGGCAQTAGGETSCWTWTQEGPGALMTVADVTDATAIAVGGQHRCAVLPNGTVSCWGKNGAGQLGVPPQDVPQSDRPVQARGLEAASGVAAGRHFTCVLGSDRKVRCFGDNLVGQLGYAGPSTYSPVEVVGVEDAVEVTAGEYHACARLGSGEVRCWGRNLNGQLGDRTTEDRKEAVPVYELQGATRVTAGTDHTCAMGVPGEIYCWGANASGQLGDGTFEDRNHKVAVEGFGG